MSEQESSRDEAIDQQRRKSLQAGALCGAGVALGGIGAAFAEGDAGPAPAPAPAGVADPRVGDFGRVGVQGYRDRAGIELKAVPSSCLQCVAVCGIVGYLRGGRLVKVEGNPHSPNNRGMICAKGQAAPNQLYDPDRLLHPLVRVGKRGEGKWKRVSMKEALDLVAFGGEIAGRSRKGLKAIYESARPEEFMFHYGRSRIKAAVKHFVTTAFGSKTIGNHTSICETAKWLGNEVTMGKHYDVNDLAHAEMILVVGANVLEAHTSHSYIAQRFIEARDRGARTVTLDVRMSNTAAMSDEWVPVRPGTDLAVLLALTHVVLHETTAGERLYDEAFIARWTNVGVDALRAHYARYTPAWAETESGVPAATIRRLAIDLATRRPSTIVTYRGCVGHYNGAYAEWAARVLDGLLGNMMVRGGTLMKVSGKCADAYAAVTKKHPDARRKARKLDVIDGDDLVLPTHHACQWIYERIAAGKHGRPALYMTYCYNGAYTTGDCARNLEVLADEEAMPFIVAVDVAMSETTAMADVILPDATYLERWTIETPQSYAIEPFIQLRQPMVPPAGESMDMQDIFIQLARRIGGGIAALHPFDSAEAYCRTSVEAQEAAQRKAGKPFYGVDGAPVEGSGWDYLRRHGVLRQAVAPSYEGHEKPLTRAMVERATVDEATGVVWSPAKAGVAAEVAARGYTGAKNAYKGYLGQCLSKTADGRWDPASARAGFKPDKLNKSGRFEVRSAFMARGAEPVGGDIAACLTDDEKSWLPAHLASGLPCWVPVPEHRSKAADELVMISFKVNVQIHSRSQNCKWLQEIHHANPAWIHPATARRLLGEDVASGDMVEIAQAMPPVAGRPATTAQTITVKLHLTEAIHPEAIAVSFHCGHWAYGRYASGEPLDRALTGAPPDGDAIWWQAGAPRPGDPTRWSDIRGVHPNWVIGNRPARVSGQFRSNDTLVKLRRLADPPA